MRTIETENRVITSLSEKAQEEVLLLKGPCGARVVVMSPEEFARRWLPGQSQQSDNFNAAQSDSDINILSMRDYIIRQ